jgi:hypothetical protein
MTSLDLLLKQLQDQSGLAWNDETYDLALARGLDGEERATYVAALTKNSLEGDTHAILTLGHLRAAEALPMVRAAANGAHPWAGTARRALVLYGHGAEVVDAIVHDALHSPGMMWRVAAVMDLATVGGPKAIAGLERALGDVDSTVRMIAWDGVVSVFGLRPTMCGPNGTLGMACVPEFLKSYLACDLKSLIVIGVERMRAIVKDLTLGGDPKVLGLGYMENPAPEIWEELRVAMFDADAAYPVERISKLRGDWRRWAEACVAMRLDQATPDPRAADALAALSAGWAIPVLEEVAASATLELRDKLSFAIARLRSTS